MKSKKKKADLFTMIELLVTVAILAVLISLLQPSLQNTLKSAKGVVCSNNLKGIGIAMSGYTYDYSRFTPYFRACPKVF